MLWPEVQEKRVGEAEPELGWVLGGERVGLGVCGAGRAGVCWWMKLVDKGVRHCGNLLRQLVMWVHVGFP